jgi:hypothetical protein
MGFRVVTRRINALSPGNPVTSLSFRPKAMSCSRRAKSPPCRRCPVRATIDLSPRCHPAHTLQVENDSFILSRADETRCQMPTMDEYTADAFANRDEPIPLFTVTASDEGSVSEPERVGKRDRLKQSASRMKAVAQDLGAEHAQRLQNNGTSLQDRLFAKYVLAVSHSRYTKLTRQHRLLQQVVPPQDVDSGPEALPDPRSSKYVQRPAFSLPLMTNNFRRFNAR